MRICPFKEKYTPEYNKNYVQFRRFIQPGDLSIMNLPETRILFPSEKGNKTAPFLENRYF